MQAKKHRRARRTLDPQEQLRRAAKIAVALPDSDIAHRHLALAVDRFERRAA